MIVSFDPGFGNVKLYGPTGHVVIQSAVATDGGAHLGRMTGLRRADPPIRIATEQGGFYVGEGCHDWGRPVESLDFDRLTGSPEITALFYAAVTAYHQRNGAIVAPDILRPVDLMVGLPVESLTGDGADEIKRGVARWLKGRHEWDIDHKGDCLRYDIDVDRVRITSQPVGALFDWLLDDCGDWIPERRALFRKEIGILGVGMNTVDLLVVRNGRPVHRFTGGENRGVRRLLELCNGHNTWSLAELDVQLRARSLDASAATEIWAREVLGLLERQWEGHWRRFAAVIVVGGGALLLRDELLRRFSGRAWIPDDPVISTARGLYKYGLLKK